MNVNTASIISYVDCVCKDAAKSENRPFDVLWQFCIVKDNVILSVKTKYNRVAVRVLYRLVRNFNKRFPTLHLRLVSSGIFDMRVMFDSEFDNVHGFNVHPLSQGIDPNYSFTEWDLFGEPVTIQTFVDDSLISPDAGKPGKEVVNKHYENFINLTGDNAYFVKTHDWNTYCKNYEKYMECSHIKSNKPIRIIKEEIM